MTDIMDGMRNVYVTRSGKSQGILFWAKRRGGGGFIFNRPKVRVTRHVRASLLFFMFLIQTGEKNRVGRSEK